MNRISVPGMLPIDRRSVIRAGLSLGVLSLTGTARATLMRGLPLADLVLRSHHVVVLTALDSRCLSLELGGRRAIVTETRLRVEDALARITPNASEVVVRTLGGKLGGEGELVHGQAEFVLNQRCVAFLSRGQDESLWVTGMAQGHYPLELPTADPRLTVSPRLPTLRDWEHSGVRALAGQALSQARRLVVQAARP